jgi:hypothetical protein
MTGASGQAGTTSLPPIEPQVVAEVVGALSARLAKRLDSAVTKILVRPRSWSEDDTELRIAVDEDAELVLRTHGGIVASVEAVTCSCLLAPACLHRAAIVSAAPLAGAHGASPEDPGTAPSVDSAVEQPTSPPAALAQAASAGTEPADKVASAESADLRLTPRERDAAVSLWHAAATVLTAGTGGSGALLQAELLRAAHTGALAGLHRAAAAAVRVTALVRAARDDDPSFRLADLAAALRELLLVTHRLSADHAPGTDRLETLRGTARQGYTPAGSLRLYGLFAEPILTGTHVGAVTYLVDRAGVISSIADVLPHDGNPDPAAARAAAGNAVRIGDTVLTHLQLSRGGLNLSGATRSATGRLGAGRGVRAVGASGAGWTQTPLAALWAQPLRDQLDRALASRSLPTAERPAGSDLLFADLTVLGPAGGQLLAQADGASTPVALLPAHPDPDLPYARNLTALSAHPGLRLRALGRVAATDRPALHLLAAEIGDHRVNTGLAALPPLPRPTGGVHMPLAPVPLPVADDAPTHLLLRRTERALVSGRRALRHDSSAPSDSTRLRQAALPTAAALLEELHNAARDTPRDAFGRSHADDPMRFTRAWLAAVSYLSTFATTRCVDLWLGAE